MPWRCSQGGQVRRPVVDQVLRDQDTLHTLCSGGAAYDDAPVCMNRVDGARMSSFAFLVQNTFLRCPPLAPGHVFAVADCHGTAR